MKTHIYFVSKNKGQNHSARLQRKTFLRPALRRLVHTMLFGASALVMSSCASKSNESAKSSKSAANGVVIVNLLPKSGSHVSGTLTLTQKNKGLQIKGRISGLTPGEHGFHVHEKGDCSAQDASSAGGHFHLPGEIHGVPGTTSSHIGDLGNLIANSKGQVSVSIAEDRLCLNEKPCSVLGRSFIIHEKSDDLKSQPAGNSGTRVACGVVEK